MFFEQRKDHNNIKTKAKGRRKRKESCRKIGRPKLATLGVICIHMSNLLFSNEMIKLEVFFE